MTTWQAVVQMARYRQWLFFGSGVLVGGAFYVFPLLPGLFVSQFLNALSHGATVGLNLWTPLALLAPGSSPILPEPLPSRLESAEEDKTLPPFPPEGDEPLAPQGVIAGPTFDASTLEDAEDRSRFYRNLQAVTAVLTGESRRQSQTHSSSPHAPRSCGERPRRRAR